MSTTYIAAHLYTWAAIIMATVGAGLYIHGTVLRNRAEAPSIEAPDRPFNPYASGRQAPAQPLTQDELDELNAKAELHLERGIRVALFALPFLIIAGVLIATGAWSSNV